MPGSVCISPNNSFESDTTNNGSIGGAALLQPPIHRQDGQSRHVAPNTRRRFSSCRAPSEWLAKRLALQQARAREPALRARSSCDRVLPSASGSLALNGSQLARRQKYLQPKRSLYRINCPLVGDLLPQDGPPLMYASDG